MAWRCGLPTLWVGRFPSRRVDGRPAVAERVAIEDLEEWREARGMMPVRRLLFDDGSSWWPPAVLYEREEVVMAGLKDIAGEMLVLAAATGLSVRELPRGLRMELGVDDDGWHVLALSRPAVEPSEEEVAICRRVFGAPLDAEREDSPATVTLRWRVESNGLAELAVQGMLLGLD